MILAVQAPACSAPGHVAHTAIPCLRVRPASGAQQCLVQFSMKYALTSRLPAQSACGRRLPSEPCQAAAQARRLRAISSQVAQPSGDLCVSQSDSQSDSAIDDRVAVKSGGGAAQATCSSAGPVPAAGASEDVRHPGRVGVVDFNGPAGRPVSTGTGLGDVQSGTPHTAAGHRIPWRAQPGQLLFLLMSSGSCLVLY